MMTTPVPPDTRTRMTRLGAELLGWGSALLLTVIALAHLVNTDRAWLLFHDGDSVFPLLVHASIASGEPQHWALSSVLFIPELGLYFVLATVFGSGPAAQLAFAVCAMLLIYGALRFTAGAIRRDLARPGQPNRAIIAALAGFAVLVFLTLTESSINRGSFELTTLVMTTTYYAATTIALLFGVALCAWVLGAAGAGTPTASRPRVIVAVVMLGALVTVSTLSNPLIAGWLCVPAILALGFGWLLRLPRSPRVPILLALTLTLGTVLGYTARGALGDLIAKSADTYIRPDGLSISLSAYGKAAAEYLSTPGGIIGALIVLVCVGTGVFVIGRSVREHRPVTLFVALMAVGSPLVVVGGGLLLGTDAPRYLTPIFFAPLLAVTALFADQRVWPAWLERTAELTAHRYSVAQRGASVVLIAAAMIVITVAVMPDRTRANQYEADIVCTANWLASHDGIAVGSFWDARPVNGQLAQPGKLLQVDYAFNRYIWLDNRATPTPEKAAVVVQGPWGAVNVPELPAGTRAPEVIHCGQYTITNFGSPVIPIGPPHA